MHIQRLILRSLAFLSAFFILSSASLATHNFAGQITLEQSDPANPNFYRITLTTYTDPAPAGVDRCASDIEIYSVQSGPNGPVYTLITILTDIPRANGPIQASLPGDCPLPPGVARAGIPVKGSIKENIYFAEYNFPGPGRYQLRYFDLARSESVVNISEPGLEEFYLQTDLFITPPIVGNNNTPIMLNRPLEDACIGKIWTHNPGGFDQDGDSLVYYLSPSLQYDPPGSIPTTASGYRFPDDPSFGTGSTLQQDSLTGVITWDVPLQPGFYNIAFYVEEWRDGVLLGNVLRDMAILVIDCDNNPPIIETISDTCIYAGDLLEFDVKAWDPDESDSLYFRLNTGALGNNGPFALTDNPGTISGVVVDPFPGASFGFSSLPVATVNNGPGFPVDTVKGTIIWQSNCDNIRKSKYQIDFNASDNESYSQDPGGNATLTANRAVTIKVVPPPPVDLIAVKSNRSIELSWSPSVCPDRTVSYKIYRKIDGSDFMQDTICCGSKPDQQGFTLIADIFGWTNTTYIDSLNDLNEIFGTEICYVVTANYDDQNNPDLPILESCATRVACVELENSELYMTNDSVSVTSSTNGEVFVSWSLPEIDEFFPAPYTFRLYRANNNGFPAIRIADLAFQDTTYFDTGLDTEIRGYNYRVEVFDALGGRIPTSDEENIGSTIYLTTTGGNNAVTLSWTEYVPWSNSEYEVFRSVNGGAFASLATVTGTGANTHTYVDQGLDLSSEYCYFIRSTGSHNVPDVKPVLINDSQVSCSFARDEEPPCPPLVTAEGDCENRVYTITVTKEDPTCAGDTDFITVKFGASEVGPFREVLRIPYNSFGADTTIMISGGQGQDFAGCYTATATDTLGNESTVSAASCIDFCPSLVMANVFSPNDDGINDILRPVQFQDVILKEIHIYDRWGRLVYQTTGRIDQLWDGSVDFSNKPAVEGVYYYYLRYEELGIAGNTPRDLKGWVTLVR